MHTNIQKVYNNLITIFNNTMIAYNSIMAVLLSGLFQNDHNDIVKGRLKFLVNQIEQPMKPVKIRLSKENQFYH